MFLFCLLSRFGGTFSVRRFYLTTFLYMSCQFEVYWAILIYVLAAEFVSLYMNWVDQTFASKQIQRQKETIENLFLLRVSYDVN